MVQKSFFFNSLFFFVFCCFPKKISGGKGDSFKNFFHLIFGFFAVFCYAKPFSEFQVSSYWLCSGPMGRMNVSSLIRKKTYVLSAVLTFYDFFLLTRISKNFRKSYLLLEKRFSLMEDFKKHTLC